MKQHFKVHHLDVQNQLQNYIYILEDTQTQDAVVIDPTEADLVIAYCSQHQLNIQQIWITHHHHDHVGGVPALVEKFPNIQVYAPALEQDKIPCVSHAVAHEDNFKFKQLEVNAILTAGHTLGHMCYFIDALDILFSGDTLFVMGCGRVFEGTFAQMYHSLNRLAALPPRTAVYCTHEYTQSNAKFALFVEPDNIAIQQRAKDIDELRAKGQPTIPSTIMQELETNPFLRVLSEQEFERLRKMKDEF